MHFHTAMESLEKAHLEKSLTTFFKTKLSDIDENADINIQK